MPEFRRLLAPVVMVAAMTVVPAVSANADAPPWGGAWNSDLRADHALAGQVLDARTAAPLDAEAVRDRLVGARFVLLGETHDSADAHRAQAWLLGLMIEAGRHPAVVWEMLDSDQGEALAAFLAGDDPTAEAMGEAVGWADSGWPDWAIYRPIAEQALSAGLPQVTGNLPLQTVRAIAQDGLEPVLGQDGLAALGLDAPLPEPLRAALSDEILRGHCGMLPETAVPPMIDAQRARDGEMARAMIRGAALPGTDGAVLIAGNGHVRADRGVPWVLTQLDGGAVETGDGLVVGVLELPPDMPADPAPTDLRDSTTPEGAPPPYDLVLFVPAVDDEDPCEKFRDQLERMREKHQSTDE